MRVFVTLDDDLYRDLQNQSLRRGVSFHVLLNEVVARGLQTEVPVVEGSSGNGGPKKGRGAGAGAGRKPLTFEELLKRL